MLARPLFAPQKAPKSLRLLSLLATLVVVPLMSTVGWANSCSTISLSLGGPPVTCTLPEQTPELTLTSTLTGLSFKAQAQGIVLIYDDTAHTLLSDVVTFTNVGGIATVAFFSDTDGIPLTAQGLHILGQFTESNKPVSISVALLNGQFLNTKICSDLAESASCSGGSDSISLSERTNTVPEPGTLMLLGPGLLGTAKLWWGRLKKEKRLSGTESCQ